MRSPVAVALLRPWIDAGDVGTLTISWLEKQCQIQRLGELVRPGNFFDFTRYRPTLYRSEGQSHVVLPNTRINYGRMADGKDIIFIHLLEPHMFGEIYVDSVNRILAKLDVKKFILVGSMYDYVPHTRPLLVSGGAVGKTAVYQLEVAGVRNSRYEGPTSITSLITQKASEAGIDSMTMIVHLPQYTELEEDYLGVVRLMQIFSQLFGTSIDEALLKKAEKQREQITEAVAASPELKGILEQLESHYDRRSARMQPHDEKPPQLSPDVERFLKEMENRFGRDEG
jgi:predicted ATP-grasp superfamily ATP-dependent carboligase